MNKVVMQLLKKQAYAVQVQLIAKIGKYTLPMQMLQIQLLMIFLIAKMSADHLLKPVIIK